MKDFQYCKNYHDFKNICVIFLFIIAMFVQSRNLKISLILLQES
jgi:hypothetical protein